VTETERSDLEARATKLLAALANTPLSTRCKGPADPRTHVILLLEKNPSEPWVVFEGCLKDFEEEAGCKGLSRALTEAKKEPQYGTDYPVLCVLGSRVVVGWTTLKFIQLGGDA
jgi:hypothetical protein